DPAAREPVETEAPAKPAPPPEVARVDVPAPPSPPAAGAAIGELEQRLAHGDPQRELRAALGTMLAAWHAAPPRPDEKVAAEQLEPVAWERGLEDLRLTGNLTMLRLLDLPAVLELRLPGTSGAHYVALTGAKEDHVLLMLDGET